MHAWSTSMLFVVVFRIYAQHGEVAAKKGGWSPCNSHGNFIDEHGKIWKNHGIVFLNFCGGQYIRYSN